MTTYTRKPVTYTISVDNMKNISYNINNNIF